MINRLVKILIIIVIPLMVALSIYALFRTDKLTVYYWFPILKQIRHALISKLDFNLNFLSKPVRGFLIYSLPDGLWLYSFTCFMILIWDNSKSKFKYFWMYIGTLIALTQKLGQGLGIFSGTFDINDVVIYLIATLVATLITKKYFREVNIL